MVQSYKQNHRLQKAYDTIIIGSGMGSLCTAALLSKEGQKVLILERHYTPGGFTHVFKRKNYEWDVGIHYIGEMQRKNSAMRKLFDYISDGRMEWEDMGEVYDRIIIGEKKYDFKRGTENFIEQMVKYFPNEEDAIRKYVDLVFKATKASRNFYINKALPPFQSKLTALTMRRPFYKYSDRTDVFATGSSC